MDQFTVFSDQNGSNPKDGDDPFLPNFPQYPNHTNSFNYQVPSPDLSFMDSPFFTPSPDPEPDSFPPSVSVSSNEIFSGKEGDSSSPSNDSESSDPVLKYITQMLMEENMENLPWEYQNPYALQDTEQSLYQALGDQYQHQHQHPPVPNQPQEFFQYQIVESPDSVFSVSIENGSNSHSSPSPGTSSGTENLWINDAEDFNVSQLQVPVPSNSNQVATNYRFDSSPNPRDISNQQMVQNMMHDVESILQFQRGFEEGNKFLPIIDLQSGAFGANQKALGVSNTVNAVKEDKKRRQQSPGGRDDGDLEEERSAKQSAVFEEEAQESEQLTEMFDKVLLICKPLGTAAVKCEGYEAVKCEETKPVETSGQPNGGKARSKKREKKKETVDLRTLLVLCAQAVSNFDQRTAGELLKQIREHSNPTGDASQRLAHYFANGLEARLEGIVSGGQNFYTSLAFQKMTAADILKAYKAHLTACPFKKLSIVFANKMICDLAEKKNAKVLHIVDFGILFGFQWPILIQLLSMRKDAAPPKLRITGIEYPQRGFRPAQRIEETGRRLAKYCERFNVPFEYHAIAEQHWEKIKLEDLKLDHDNEMLAVNNFFRFETLLEETAGVDCPRNAVLSLVKSMNPDIVVHMAVNGAYNAPFFLTRFREALFHFSAIFDVFDTTLSRDNENRLLLESEFYGREAMNVVACEGAERVQRAETYKQWHQRYVRAGFKALPLEAELMEILRGKLKNYYHKDFVMDEDGYCVMQGWKGRILYAASCWVPE